jgi:hypothetical protein
MKLNMLAFTLAAVAIAYSALQLIEPEQKVNAGGACCTYSSDCRVPGWTCTNCQQKCSSINVGFCGTNECP